MFEKAGEIVEATPIEVILTLESTVNGVIEVVLLLYVPAVTPDAANVAAKEEVPEPVTSPVKVIVWSPVLVPDNVVSPLKIIVRLKSPVFILRVLVVDKSAIFKICK